MLKIIKFECECGCENAYDLSSEYLNDTIQCMLCEEIYIEEE